jgi:hydrogenase-4 component F
VGIALALLGNFFLALSSATKGSSSLLLADLLREGVKLDSLWLKAGFLCMLVGYGTKMGLAPMHTWLPDAHSEAPSVVSALLSGALLNCAFLSIFRSLQVCHAAGQGPFAQKLLMTFGLISIFCAAIFILAQADYKRMLAYSSVEHMGIVALGVGIGGTAVFGAMLHAVNHSLAKALLFLAAGNILEAYRTKVVKEVHGVTRVLPWTGFFWILGLLAISGYPPFGPFLSKFIILKEALAKGYYAPAIIFIALLAMIFIGMTTVVLGMAQGNPPAGMERKKEPWSAVAPLAVFAALLLILGVYIPDFFESALKQVAQFVGGK